MTLTSCPRTGLPVSKHRANARSSALAIRQQLDEMIEAQTSTFDGHCSSCREPTTRPMLVICNGWACFFCPDCYSEL